MTTKAYIEAFKRAQLEVIAQLQRKAIADSVAEYEQQLFAEIDGILRALGVDTQAWLESAVPLVYKQTANAAYRQLSFTPSVGVSFTGVNQAAVRVIVGEAQADMTTSLVQIGRRIDDQIRQAGLRAAQLKLTTNQTLRKMQESLEREFLEQGYVMGVPDSRGRMMNVEAYTETFTRAITREATNTATMNTGHELGCHLFKMSTHYPTCKLCAPRQDRVYRDIEFPEGDERNQFPHISMAFPGWPQYKNVHPRCLHVIVAIGWDALSRETQLQYLTEAGKPFNVDPRSEKEIRAYDLGQAEYRMMRNDRKQWERMRARLGDDAPSTFSAFRRLKYSDNGINKAYYGKDASGNEVLYAGKAGNSERWHMMQLDYRRRGLLLDDPTKGLPNSDSVSIDKRKFTEYIFNKANSDGWAKGIAFSSRLGYNQGNWEDLRQELKQRASLYPAKVMNQNEFGTRYEQRMILYGLKNTPTNVVVGWMAGAGKTKMITAYVKEVEQRGTD